MLFESSFANVEFSSFHRDRQEKAAEQDREANAGDSQCQSKSCYRYYDESLAEYFVESLPKISLPMGELYSGSVPIDESDPNRTLFFVFKPATEKPVNDLTIWLNGGPGCSSLTGFLTENGPISWQAGTAHPKKNPYSWAKITNMLWVDQPIGTGFSQGQVTARNEVETAKDFVGFFKNFQKLFGIHNYKIYVTVLLICIV